MKLQASQSFGLVIDIQERMVPALCQGDKMVERCVTLCHGLRVLDIPIMAARHYPKGLGDIPQVLREAIGPHQPMDKLSFSLLGEETHSKALRDTGRNTAIVCGAEAHVCVLQTVVDLREQGYTVALVRDCIASRESIDMDTALRRAEQEGAILCTMESILFELTGRAGTDAFKAIHQLVK